MQKYKIFTLLIFIGFVFSGCIRNRVDPPDSGCNANFVVDRVQGELRISQESALPEKFTLKLKICSMRAQGLIERKLPSTFWFLSLNKKLLPPDRKTTKEIEESPLFSKKLDSENQPLIYLKADGDGCLEWSETYDYAYSKESKWIVINRHVMGNEYIGTCEVPIAVNPWLQVKDPEIQTNQVVDYRKEYQKEYEDILITEENKKRSEEIRRVTLAEGDGLEFLKKKKEEERKNKVDLIVDNLNFHRSISDSQNSKLFLKENFIEAQLQYRIKDINDNFQYNLIKHGEFKIVPHFLSRDLDETDDNNHVKKYKYRKINREAENTFINTRFENNMLISEPFQWEVPFKNDQSSIWLYLKITPQKGTEERIKPFEGIYKIGDTFKTISTQPTIETRLRHILRSKYLGKLETDNQNPRMVTQSSKPQGYLSDIECLRDWWQVGYDLLDCVLLDQPDGSTDNYSPSGWTVEKMNLRFSQMVTENWLFRDINTIVETSVVDSLGEKVKNKDINIEVTDLSTGIKETYKKTTDINNGSISFNIPTRQNWYKKQRYFLKLIRFSASELQVDKIVAINPWDYGFTHGFEVNQPNDIRATCLEPTNSTLAEDENRVLKSLWTSFEENQKFDPDQIKFVQKLFCYNWGYAPAEETEDENKWQGIFNAFARILKTTKTRGISLYSAFRSKFKSVKKALNPVSYVHLFRAVNLYPTYQIDHSLGRSFYYNTQIKLSPRVVRYDDIARGQQNKGPLRDGIYVLRLAMLKNDQDRFHGRDAMVQALTGEFYDQPAEKKKDGDPSIYNCFKDDKHCINLEDFIMPPQNIPVVVRDGMVRTGVPIYIKRELMLFADAKNTLVFQLLPADPKSVICKEEKKDCARGGLDGYYLPGDWSKGFDWPKTLRRIQPANPLDYDMFFHTYKTPFIPAEWTNWTITRELSESFDDLKTTYHRLSSVDALKSLFHGLSDQIQQSFKNQNSARVCQNPPCDLNDSANIPDELGFLRSFHANTKNILNNMGDEGTQNMENTAGEIREQLNSFRSQVEADTHRPWENKKALLNQIDRLLKGDEFFLGQLRQRKQEISDTHELSEEQKEAELKELDQLMAQVEKESVLHQLKRRKQEISDTHELSEEQKEAELKELDQSIGRIEKEPLLARLLSPLQIVRPAVESAYPETGVSDKLSAGSSASGESEEEKSMPNSLNTSGDSFADACAGADLEGEEYFKSSDKRACPRSDKPTLSAKAEDLSDTHIENFASQNALCTIGINTEEPLPKACGSPDKAVTTHTLLDDLNNQINTVNEVKKEFREEFLPSEDQRQLSMSETFVESSEDLLHFNGKIHGMPHLSEKLTAQDLKQIIRHGSTNPNKFNDKGLMDITDSKTGSFLHALCGFWFKDFVSQKYSSLGLLQDGLRQVIRESVDYQARILSMPLSTMWDKKPADLPQISKGLTLTDQIIGELDYIKNDQNETEMSQAIAQLEQTVQEKQSTGVIDYFHQWAERKIEPQVDFNRSLTTSLEDILTKTPFVRYQKEGAVYKANNSSNLPECGNPHSNSKPCFDTKQHLNWKLLLSLNDSHVSHIANGLTLKDQMIGSILNRGRKNTLDVNHPFKKCINNPSHFFGLEKKVIVGQVDDKGLSYSQEGGQITRLNVTESFLMNTQRDQGSNQGFNTNIGLGDLTLLSTGVLLSRQRITNWIARHPVLSVASILLAYTGLKAGVGYDWRVYEGTGKRRWFSIGVVEGVELVSERTPMEIPLKKYHECLVIRPRFNAFERGRDKYKPIWREIKDQNGKTFPMPNAIKAVYEKTGLMLCAEGENPDYRIEEDYYYIYPDYAVNSVSSNPRSPRNRPFAISLRGRQAYHRFKDSLSCSVAETTQPIKDNQPCRDTTGQYEHLFSKHIEFADNLEKGFETPKLFHRIGDFPGVYSPYVEPRDREIKTDQRWYHSLINWFADYMDLDLEKIIYKEPE